MRALTVAVVGRPNVGKSSYFNAVVGRRVAIVEPTPGVTRDRVCADVELGGRTFQLMDTGGIGVVDEAALDADIENQIDIALHLADVVIFLVDGRDGVTPLDERVAEQLRRLEKPLVLGVNKIDHPSREELALDFWALGLGEPSVVSANEGMGVEALLERAVELLPAAEEGETAEDSLPHIALVGKRNVGKSTLLNHLAGESRVIVSDVAGTTRDAIDVTLEFGGRRFVAIDTAGVMKKGKVNSSIEFYSQARTEAAIRRADVVLFLFDPTLEVSQVDKKIAMQLSDACRPCVLVVNKWDLARDSIATGEFMEYLADRLPGLHFAPVVFISALEELNTTGLLDVAFDLDQQARRRVGTGELNRVLEEAFARRRPGGKQGYKAKLFFGTQVETSPPTFVVFVNEPQLYPANYARYLENRLRDAFDFSEIPIRVFLRKRTSIYHD